MLEQIEQALNESLTRMLNMAAGLLPGMAALILALFAATFLAWIMRVLLRRSLAGIRFDERAAGWGFPLLVEWAPSRRPTLLVTRVVSWVVIAGGFLIGVSAFDVSVTSQLVHSLFDYVPNVLGALVVLLAGTVISRFLARSVLIGAVNMNLQYARLLSAGVKWLVMVLAVAMALEHLKIGAGIVQLAFGILFGGIVFALALAVGLGSRDAVARSLEREAGRTPAENAEEPFRHL